MEAIWRQLPQTVKVITKIAFMVRRSSKAFVITIHSSLQGIQEHWVPVATILSVVLDLLNGKGWNVCQRAHRETSLDGAWQLCVNTSEIINNEPYLDLFVIDFYLKFTKLKCYINVMFVDWNIRTVPTLFP